MDRIRYISFSQTRNKPGMLSSKAMMLIYAAFMNKAICREIMQADKSFVYSRCKISAILRNS
jgi:hypothetical protein